MVTGKEQIPLKGPLILVANHPNTLMDPLLLASITDQRVGFIANASIFINSLITHIFNYFHVIPIFRKKDVKPGEKPDNRKAFSKCHEYLGGRGTLLIFPEGTSHYELNLREIKTGTARIALSFEEAQGFEGNLRIVPIALDYSDSIQFRSVVSVTVCKSISVGAYELAYEKNEYEAVNLLTEEIRRELSELIPETSGKEQEYFLVKAHQFYTTFYAPKAALAVNPKQALDLRKQVSKALDFLLKENKNLYTETQAQVMHFFGLLKQEGLTLSVVAKGIDQKTHIIGYIGQTLKFIFLFPVYLFGLLTNFIPYRLTAHIFTSLNLDIEYKAPVQMLTGLFTFPIYYGLVIWLYRYFITMEFWPNLLLFLLLPIAGFMTLYFYAEIRRFFQRLRFDFYISNKRKSKIIDLHDKITKNMEKARKDYLENAGLNGVKNSRLV